MPRSRLMSQLAQMAANQRVALEKDVSLETVRGWREEAAEQRRLSPVTRRHFLKGAGIAAASGLLAGRARAATQPTIAVVGAGIAGLSCALKLADKGYDSTVYEARPQRIGGRMHSSTDYFRQGQVAEFCGELIDTNHRTIRALARRFDLDVVDLLAAEPRRSEDTYKFFGSYYPRAQAEADFAAVYVKLSDALAGAGYPTTYNLSTAAGRALDNTSLFDWIEQNIPGGHSSPMGALFDIAYTEELASPTEVQSSLNMIYLLAFQDHPKHFEMFGSSDERFHIAGGNDQLPQAIANALPAGTVKKGHALESIRKKPDGRYTLGFDGKPDVTADYVVLCIPFAILKGLDYAQAGFDDLKRYAIQNLGAGKSGKLALQFTSRLWDGTGAWPGIGNGTSYADTGYMNAWDVTRAQAGDFGILVDYTGGPAAQAMSTNTAYADASRASVRADAAQFLARLESVYPGISALANGKALSSLPHLDPFLKLSYSHWEVGQYQTFGGYEGVRQANCLFAGEHTSVDFQGFMEGGATSGQAAAMEIVRDLR